MSPYPCHVAVIRETPRGPSCSKEQQQLTQRAPSVLLEHKTSVLLQKHTPLCERWLRSSRCSMSARALPPELSLRLPAVRLRHGEQHAGEESR